VSARPPGWRVAALGTALAVGGAWQAVAILVFLAAVLWADEAAGTLVRAAGAVRERARQRRRLELLELRLLEHQAALALPGPTPCAHRKAVPVPGIGGNVVAWLCPQCDAQLPAEFSVCEEAR
jgi:hypothetical protein